ncbi:protein MAINTENANCE OF MERISTEMS-like [Gossypium raimondii]|uniref:protein MAINTENANCE OF MERISTEMS-like n=1 Tax=Gossypium raimondii TaxID=29730 RepID=UPI00063ADBF4|nr:protein MAINTENANCE OF MERISTEMS-like [Gossypium raimondii]
MPYLEQAGFRSAALIQTFDLRYDLISALVERWRPETHTFHFSCGECIMTLEDVALQLGLLINESPPTRRLDESNFSGLKFTWLKVKFGHLSANATEGELMCAAGAWGSAVLAVLYRELCWTAKPAVIDIGGCLTLLQSWALYRMSFLASVSHQPYVYPLVNRWSIYPGIEKSYTVPIYRLMIEQHTGEGMVMASDLQPSVEYKQWHSSLAKPYLLGG